MIPPVYIAPANLSSLAPGDFFSLAPANLAALVPANLSILAPANFSSGLGIIPSPGIFPGKIPLPHPFAALECHSMTCILLLSTTSLEFLLTKNVKWRDSRQLNEIVARRGQTADVKGRAGALDVARKVSGALNSAGMVVVAGEMMGEGGGGGPSGSARPPCWGSRFSPENRKKPKGKKKTRRGQRFRRGYKNADDSVLIRTES